MIKAVLFDFFGVVGMDSYWTSVQNFQSENGTSAHLAELTNEINIGKMSWDDFCEEIANSLAITAAEVEARYSNYRLNKDIVAFARQLKPHYTVALASNAHADYLGPILESTHLSTVFAPLFISSEMGVAKPDPRFFEQIMQSLQIDPSECLFLDDSARNVDGAVEIGMKGVIFDNSPQAIQEMTEILSN